MSDINLVPKLTNSKRTTDINSSLGVGSVLVSAPVMKALGSGLAQQHTDLFGAASTTRLGVGSVLDSAPVMKALGAGWAEQYKGLFGQLRVEASLATSPVMKALGASWGAQNKDLVRRLGDLSGLGLGVGELSQFARKTERAQPAKWTETQFKTTVRADPFDALAPTVLVDALRSQSMDSVADLLESGWWLLKSEDPARVSLVGHVVVEVLDRVLKQFAPDNRVLTWLVANDRLDASDDAPRIKLRDRIEYLVDVSGGSPELHSSHIADLVEVWRRGQDAKHHSIGEAHHLARYLMTVQVFLHEVLGLYF